MMLSVAKEKRQHGSMQVPYSYYDCRMPDYFPGVPLHWHGEMELNYIKRGTGYFQYEDRLLTAHAGDIFLIQPNLVHAILPAATRKFCSRFSPPGAASRHRFHPNIPVMLHFLHPSIRFSAASVKTLLSPIFC